MPVLDLAGFVAAVAPPPPEERSRLRRDLGIGDDELVVASFGFVTPQKRLEPALAAFAKLRAEPAGGRRLRFAIVGEVSPHYDLDELLSRTTREGVTVVGRADARTFHAWMAAADVAVNLRHPTGGETSASFLRLLALGKPTLVLRDKTERTEGLGGGVVLVGTDVERIVAETSRLLLDAAHYERMASAVSPYGDGTAAEKIVAHLARELTADVRRASTVKLRAA